MKNTYCTNFGPRRDFILFNQTSQNKSNLLPTKVFQPKKNGVRLFIAVVMNTLTEGTLNFIEINT